MAILITPRAWYPSRTWNIIAALKHQRTTIESITLHHDYYEWVEDFSNDQNAMDPVILKDFPALKRLELALPLIFGQDAVKFGEGNTTTTATEPLTEEELKVASKRLADALPPQIEELGFAEMGDKRAAKLLDTALAYLVERREEACPNLRKIMVSFTKELALDVAKELVASLLLARAAGIELQYRAQE